MELQLAVQSARSNGRNHRTGTAAKPIPNYLKPSTGSCHHACKYGGAHAFEEKEPPRAAQPKPRKQPPPLAPDHQNTRARLLPRKLFGGRGRGGNNKGESAGADREKKKLAESVEWKDIVAYDTVPAQQHGSLPVPVLDVEKDVTRGRKPHEKAEKNPDQVDGVTSQSNEPLLDRKLVINKSVGSKMAMTTSSKVSTHRNMDTDTSKSVRPPRGKKPAVSVAGKKAGVDQELVDGYRPLSPSLLQKRASLLRDLEEEMVHGSTHTNGFEATCYSLDQEEYAAAVETSRPVVPAHRRVKSMSVSSRSVRFPFARQASRNSATFKLRSRSSRGPPSEEEKPPARSSGRGSVGGGEDTGRAGRGVQLRIRSLRRRGVGGSGGGASTGFVVPAVSLRHQKTLERKRSQRLYNNVIEETASKLVKTRKSRVKALVGAFESVISRIAK